MNSLVALASLALPLTALVIVGLPALLDLILGAIDDLDAMRRKH